MQARPDRDTHCDAHLGDFEIHAGESLFIDLAAGVRLTVATGRLRVTGAPRWLGGQVFSVQTTLVKGEVWLLEESGWVTLAATRDCRLNICSSKVPAYSTNLTSWLRRATGLLTSGRTARMGAGI